MRTEKEVRLMQGNEACAEGVIDEKIQREREEKQVK